MYTVAYRETMGLRERNTHPQMLTFKLAATTASADVGPVPPNHLSLIAVIQLIFQACPTS